VLGQLVVVSNTTPLTISLSIHNTTSNSIRSVIAAYLHKKCSVYKGKLLEKIIITILEFILLFYEISQSKLRIHLLDNLWSKELEEENKVILGWCMFAKFSSTEIFSNLYFSFSQLM
jgi:hypothetical protein